MSGLGKDEAKRSEPQKDGLPPCDALKDCAESSLITRYSETAISEMMKEIEAKLLEGTATLNPSERAVFNTLAWELSNLRNRDPGTIYQSFKNVQKRLGMVAAGLESEYSAKHSTSFVNFWFDSLPIEDACAVVLGMSEKWQGHSADTDYEKMYFKYEGDYDLIHRVLGPPGIKNNFRDPEVGDAFIKVYEYRNNGYGLRRGNNYFPPSVTASAMHSELKVMIGKGEIVPFSPFNTHRREEGFYRSYYAYTSRVPFGQGHESIRMIEAIEHAVEDGQARGGTIFVHGRLDVDFLEKLTTSDASGRLIKPDVEIIYSLRLPSGVDHHFVIKPARDFTLKPKNDYANYTEEDFELVAKLDAHFQRRDTRNPDSNYRNALKIFNELTPGDFPEALKDLLNEPLLIQDLLDLCRYEDARVKSIWRKLRELEPGLEQQEYDYGHRALYADRGVFRAALVNGLQRLCTYRHLAHHEAVPQTEEATQEFFDLYEEKLYELCRKQRDAILNETEADQKKRENLGYMGPSELYGLPLEHMIYDMVCDFNVVKSGRGRRREYGDRSKIYVVEDLPALLNGKEFQRIVTAHVSDPRSNSSETVKGEKKVRELFPRMLDENLARIRNASCEGRLANEVEEITLRNLLLFLDKHIVELETSRKTLNSELWKALEKASIQAKEDGLGPSEKKKLLSGIRAEFAERVRNIDEEILLRKLNFERIVSRTFARFAKDNLLHLNSIEDSYTAKFIYTIGRGEDIRISPEVVDGNSIHRKTHSETAEGESLAAAGEIVFTRYQKHFTNWHNWLRFTENAEQFCSLPWRMTEKNNATGHYMMPPTILAYASALLVPAIERVGIPAKNARSVDKLVPGIRLQGLGTYW